MVGGLEPTTKKEFSKTPLAQKGDFIKAAGQACEQEELHWGCEEWLVLYYEVGGGKVKRETLQGGPEDAKEDPEDT